MWCNATTANILKNDAIFVFEDSLAKLSFKEVQKLPISYFKDDIIFAKNKSSNYWLRFSFPNSEGIEILEILTPHTEYIDFYQPLDSGYHQTITGHLKNSYTRPYLHKNFVFDIASSDFSKPFFIKIKSKNPVGFFIKAQTRKEFHRYSIQEYLLLGLYYGALLILVLYHLVVFVVIRKLVYIAYILTVIVAGLISLSDDGLGVLYVWNNYLELSRPLGLYILPTLYLLFFGTYSFAFLGEGNPIFKKIITGVIGLYLIYFFIDIIFISDNYTFSFIYNIPFIVIYLVYLVHFIKTLKKSSLFFLIGFTFSLFGILINQLRLSGYLEGNILTVYAFNVGVFLEFLSLALSISYKYKEENKLKKSAIKGQIRLLQEKNIAQKKMVQAIAEKEQATLEINKKLEIKVEERTKQLNNLIDKLRGLNFEYDKENWDLKRSVKAEKVSKLNQEIITLPEMRELFPSNYKCYEFLAELKWSGDNYSCPKCNYENYSVNKTNLSRKCSKCGYANSVTKDTVVQYQKIPLTSLFYICYLWFKDPKLNVIALSDELKISEVSIYKFIAKLKQKNQELNKQKKSISSWKDLLL